MAKEKPVYPRTVSEQLFLAWQKFRQRKDGATLSEALGYSRPVIDRALKFGYVKTQGLSDKITEFFSARLQSENKKADELNKLIDNNNLVKND